MKHSLLHPNQCRINGIDLSNHPFDKHRGPRIKDEESGLIVPMKFSHCTVGITTRAPSYEVIQVAKEASRLIAMTSEATWDPSTVSINSIKSSKQQKFSTEVNKCDNLLESCSAIYTEKAGKRGKSVNCYDE